jgi:hypothetical protein
VLLDLIRAQGWQSAYSVDGELEELTSATGMAAAADAGGMPELRVGRSPAC